MTGNQTVQQVKASLRANVVRNVNKALARADQIHNSEGNLMKIILINLN